MSDSKAENGGSGAGFSTSLSKDLLARADRAIGRLLDWTHYVGDGGCCPREVGVAERYAKRVQREIRRANNKITTIADNG